MDVPNIWMYLVQKSFFVPGTSDEKNKIKGADLTLKI